MKLMKLFLSLTLTLFCCTAFAHENKHFLIGLNGTGESAETAFIVEVSSDDLNDICVMSDEGEVYLKVDKIVAVPKEALLAYMPNTAAEAIANSFQENKYPMYECLNGHPAPNGDGWCNNKKCIFFRNMK